MRTLVAGACAAALLVTAVAGARTTAAPTPDEKFVAELVDVRAAAESAFRRLKPTPPTIADVDAARSHLAAARAGLRAAAALLPLTVGGSSSPDVTGSLGTATAQIALASADVKKASYDSARAKLKTATAATAATLRSFGVPLAKQFQAFAVYRDLSNIYGFEEYLGLTARVGAPIQKIVVGIAGRETANASEPRTKPRTPAIPITKMALYTLQEPSGAFSSGWCRLVNGILVCRLNRTMEASETFAVAFGPRVAAGTKFLVKFWSTDGERSYAVFTTR